MVLDVAVDKDEARNRLDELLQEFKSAELVTEVHRLTVAMPELFFIILKEERLATEEEEAEEVVEAAPEVEVPSPLVPEVRIKLPGRSQKECCSGPGGGT